MTNIKLLSNEKILAELKPHPLSFWPFYMFFLYYLVVSSLVIMYEERIICWLEDTFHLILSDVAIAVVFVVLWWIIVLLPAVIFSVLRIAWKWLIIYLLIAVIGTYALIKYNLPYDYLYYFVIGIGILGMMLTELYRRSFKYYLTNFRIITSVGFIFGKTRDVLYSKITDVTVEQGLLGKIFNFGSVFPITASGLGTGTDTSAVGVTIGAKKKPIVGGVTIAGAKAVKVPRGRESYILYGVPKPHDVRQMILELMKGKEPSEYLKKIVSLLEEIVERKL